MHVQAYLFKCIKPLVVIFSHKIFKLKKLIIPLIFNIQCLQYFEHIFGVIQRKFQTVLSKFSLLFSAHACLGIYSQGHTTHRPGICGGTVNALSLLVPTNGNTSAAVLWPIQWRN